jgi:hypothetical protein
MMDRPSGFRVDGACRGGDRVFLGGVAWLISIRSSHNFEGDADVAQTERASLEKKPIGLERSPGGTCTQKRRNGAHTRCGRSTRLTLILSIK